MVQLEQDLVISRAMMMIFSDGFLKEHLAFRGGTALHKLQLGPAPRYSEYMDFVVNKPPTQRQFMLNLEAKEKDPGFLGDMEGLLRPGIEYDQGQAFAWVKEEIIQRIP